MLGRLMPLVCLQIMVSAAKPPKGPIESTWIYTTPIHWQHAPHGIHERTASATIVVLYPEGGYLEVASGLIEQSDKSVTFSNGDDFIVRRGTWSRTDENAIRVTARDEFWDDKDLAHLPKAAGETEEQRPGPHVVDTCALEGTSTIHLAKKIHCHRLILTPAELRIDLSELQRMAAAEFKTNPPK